MLTKKTSKRIVHRGRKVSGKKNTCDRRKVSLVMDEWKKGKLRSSTGAKVKNQKQAIAIALSTARRYCKKSRKH